MLCFGSSLCSSLLHITTRMEMLLAFMAKPGVWECFILLLSNPVVLYYGVTQRLVLLISVYAGLMALWGLFCLLFCVAVVFGHWVGPRLVWCISNPLGVICLALLYPVSTAIVLAEQVSRVSSFFHALGPEAYPTVLQTLCIFHVCRGCVILQCDVQFLIAIFVLLASMAGVLHMPDPFCQVLSLPCVGFLAYSSPLLKMLLLAEAFRPTFGKKGRRSETVAPAVPMLDVAGLEAYKEAIT